VGVFQGKEPKMETMESEINSSTIYNALGYKDRNDYLTSLVKDFGIDMITVRMISDMLGPSEDFDGLVTALEDFESMELFD
jgi:hypothetical protein